MARTEREIRFNIKADASEAQREVADLQADIQNIRGTGAIFGDVEGAEKINSEARRTVGVLGDFDTALQTIGSTTGTTSLQVVGDFFAIGEAAGQLTGAFPLLKAQFIAFMGAINPVMAAVGAAVGVATGVILSNANRIIEESKKAENAAIAAVEASVKYANMEEEAKRQELDAKKAELDELKQINDGLRDEQERAWEERRQNETDYLFGIQFLGDAAARAGTLFYGAGNTIATAIEESDDAIEILEAEIGILEDDLGLAATAMGDFTIAIGEFAGGITDAIEEIKGKAFDRWENNIRAFSNLTEQEADELLKIKRDQLNIEEQIYNEAVSLFGVTSEQALAAADNIGTLNSEIDYLVNTDFSGTAANIEAMTAQAQQNLGDLVGNLGGLFDKTKDTIGGFFEGIVDGATEAAKDEKEAQQKINDEAAREYEAFLKAQARLREQQEREWARQLEADKRNLESQLDQIKRFEETRWRIENDFLTSRADAILENDVTALYEARRTRRQSRQEERMFGSTVVVNDLNVGAISRPEDIEAAKQMLLNALTATLAMQEGKYA